MYNIILCFLQERGRLGVGGVTDCEELVGVTHRRWWGL